jgi:glutathione S-transferase
MKLYTKPGACSTADHIALQWTGASFEVEVMTAAAMKAPEYLKINPSGAVPAIEDGDFVLTQNAAIMGYIADTHPQAKLGGDGSPRQRGEANRWLAFVNSDLHPAFHPLFGPARYLADAEAQAALREPALKRVRGLYESAEKQLQGRDWLAGFRSFADPYFYITLRWSDRLGVDLSGLPNIAAFKARMDADAGVQAALKAEGLA